MNKPWPYFTKFEFLTELIEEEKKKLDPCKVEAHDGMVEKTKAMMRTANQKVGP